MFQYLSICFNIVLRNHNDCGYGSNKKGTGIWYLTSLSFLAELPVRTVERWSPWDWCHPFEQDTWGPIWIPSINTLWRYGNDRNQAAKSMTCKSSWNIVFSMHDPELNVKPACFLHQAFLAFQKVLNPLGLLQAAIIGEISWGTMLQLAWTWNSKLVTKCTKLQAN